MLIIPAIDILGGQVVRLEGGDFGKVKAYGSALEFARKWEREGARLIHVVDLDGAKSGEPKNFDIIKDIIADIRTKVEVGGGIRSVDTVKKYLKLGAERVVLSTRIIEDASFLLNDEMKANLGRIAVSIDIKHIDSSKFATGGVGGWIQNKDVLIDIRSFVQAVAKAGVRYINFSDISKDGMMAGLDISKVLNFLDIARSSALPEINYIYAGGVSSLDDLKVLHKLGAKGVSGVIVGRALYENKFSLKEAMAIVA